MIHIVLQMKRMRFEKDAGGRWNTGCADGFGKRTGSGKPHKIGGHMEREFEGKKLLILGGNPETIPLVEIANSWGIKTIVASARDTDPAKSYAWKSYTYEGLDAGAVIRIAAEEKVDGVLVGVADILVPMYCKVCEALDLPCYATQEIVDVFSCKDVFKSTCERYGIHGIPEYYLDAGLNPKDLEKIEYPVMVKPVDNGGGVGMTAACNEEELKKGVRAALENSNKKRFIVERYMQCEDVGIYYTFKDGECSVSCIYDRYTTGRQPGMSRVNLGSIYPSKHLEDYYERMHGNAVRMFKDIGIKNGVLLISAFYENGEFYVYDPGYRLQGEAPHLLMKAVNGFDQREMLIRFALTGSVGDVDIAGRDDAAFRGKAAATFWVLLKAGKIKEIKGLENIGGDPRIAANVQRLCEGADVEESWAGTEKQVMTRLYMVCDSRNELRQCIREYEEKIKVIDENGNNMILEWLNPDGIGSDEKRARTAVITGGTSGIGYEAARQLLAEGYNVAIIGRNPRRAREAERTLGAHCRSYCCDVSDIKQIEATLQKIDTEFGTIDVLVNSAGVLDASKIDTLTEEEWDNVIGINLKGTYFMMQKAVPYLEKGTAPRIINIGSNAGRMGGFENGLAYTASKGGVIAMTYGAARRLASKGITVNCVAPGTTVTELAEKGYSEKTKQKLLERFPVGRMGRPQEIAGAISYFASEKSSFTTGAVLDVNGGMFMG